MMSEVSKLASIALVALLAFGLVWGQCAACPMPVKTAKSCCSHHSGNCRMPAPRPEPAKTCPNVALAPVSHHTTQLTPLELAAPAPVAFIAEVPAVAFELVNTRVIQPDTGPPVLYLLNSSLLV
jgi:hypothetical protein